MDLLGSIMKTMEKPPSLSKEESNQLKEKKKTVLKLKEKEKEELDKFRVHAQKMVSDFAESYFSEIPGADGGNPSKKLVKLCGRCQKCVREESLFDQRLCLPIMNKLERPIVHEFAEDAGIASYSFGIENIDKHIMLCTKEALPTDEELHCLKKGIDWLVFTHNKNVQQQRDSLKSCSQGEKVALPNSNAYASKYSHLLSSEPSSLTAEAKQSRNYGMVSSDLKKDTRSIEETLHDLKKRRKTEVGGTDER